MITALHLLVAQALLGGFDTLYYHEYRARLPGRLPGAREELLLHGARDLVYAALFGALPLYRFDGVWAWVVAALLVTEIAITLRDFVVEDRVRRPLGGVYPGERVTHAVMGILYGAALANLAPVLVESAARSSALTPWDCPPVLRGVLLVMAAGVFVSGVRDLAAALGPRWLGFPWVQR